MKACGPTRPLKEHESLLRRRPGGQIVFGCVTLVELLNLSEPWFLVCTKG